MEFYLTDNGVKTKFVYGELSISGDEEYGFRPFQLMVASIAGCSSGVFRRILKKQHIEVEELIIVAEVDRNSEEANRIEEIKLNYTVKGYDLDLDKLSKSLAVSRKNCSMIRSVEESINIIESISAIELER